MYFARIAGNSITNVGTTEGGNDIPVEELYNYIVTINKTDGGYTIKTANDEYITNTDGKPGTTLQKEKVISATSITKLQDNTFEISLSSTSTAFGYFGTNERFNYFPNSAWGNKTHISFYEFVE